MKFESYQHVNGKVIVKRFFPEIGLKIDRNSPFIKRYLGVKEADDIKEAYKMFNENNTL